MTCAYFDVQIIQRSSGQSVTASLAYRSGEKIHDKRLNKTFDYSRKEDVMRSGIMAPSPVDWNAEDFGNKIEASEKRKDAQLARSIIIALPRELDLASNERYLREAIYENFVSQGAVAHYAIHYSKSADGSDGRDGKGGGNPHAHVTVSMREQEGDGFSKKKNRSWNNRKNVDLWRESFARLQNQHLEMAGSDARVSLTSNLKQFDGKRPQIKMGYEAWQLEQRGVETEKGNHNRRITHQNAVFQIMQHHRAVAYQPIDHSEQKSYGVMLRQQKAVNQILDTRSRSIHFEQDKVLAAARSRAAAAHHHKPADRPAPGPGQQPDRTKHYDRTR